MSKLRWDALFLNGSIVSLSIGAWRARAGLKASDLGLEDSPEVAKALTLPTTRLMPRKAFEDITTESRAANALIDRYTMNFGLIRGARFIPAGQLPRLIAELEVVQGRHRAAADAFIGPDGAKFNENRDAILPVIRKAIQDAAKTPEAAEAAFQRIQAEYPTASEVREQFQLSWSIYNLSSPKTAATAEAAKQEAEGVKSILGDMVKQLREDVQVRVKELAEIALKGGKLREGSIQATMELLDRVDALNILGDTELSQQTGALRRLLRGVDPKEVGAGFVAGLSGVQEALSASVQEAVQAAEERLTGVGNRSLDLDPEEAAPESLNEAVPMDLF